MQALRENKEGKLHSLPETPPARRIPVVERSEENQRQSPPMQLHMELVPGNRVIVEKSFHGGESGPEIVFAVKNTH